MRSYLALMPQYRSASLSGQDLACTRQNTFRKSVCTAQHLSCCPVLYPSRHCQGQNVTVNFTSLSPDQSIVPQGKLQCVKFLIHNFVSLCFFWPHIRSPQTKIHKGAQNDLLMTDSKAKTKWCSLAFNIQESILNSQHCIFSFPHYEACFFPP